MPIPAEGWIAYPYKAQRENPFSIMSLDRGQLWFVTCGSDETEITKNAQWLAGLSTGHHPLCVYRNGQPYRVIRD